MIVMTLFKHDEMVASMIISLIVMVASKCSHADKMTMIELKKKLNSGETFDYQSMMKFKHARNHGKKKAFYFAPAI